MRSKKSRQARRRKAWLKYYRKKREYFYGLGLGCNGAPRISNRTRRTPSDRKDFNRSQCLKRYHARAAKYKAMGLTTRGTKKIYRIEKPISPTEKIYREVAAVPRPGNFSDFFLFRA